MTEYNEYICAVCGEIFEKGQSDEDALEELNKNYPDFSQEECELVCEDCYQIPYFKKLRKK